MVFMVTFSTVSYFSLSALFTHSFLHVAPPSLSHIKTQRLCKSRSSCTESLRATSGMTDVIPSWVELNDLFSTQPIGAALNAEVQARKNGTGLPFVHSNLRLFDSLDQKPVITLYRDHAGWCPYCQKTMLLIEEKRIPIKIELVPMRSYGDKPSEFMRLQPSGLLPTLVIEDGDGHKEVITESQVIMELLDRSHPTSAGFKPMLPSDDDKEGWARYKKLARLERELFSSWCSFLFRPESPSSSRPNFGGMMPMILGSIKSQTSQSMRDFLNCLTLVDKELLTNKDGPWFFAQYNYPTMIDFIFISHVERMLASCAYWKGLDIRSKEMKSEYPGINRWLDAFDKRESHFAFKSDYYTHVKNIPPQYGPAYEGGFRDIQPIYRKMIDGKDGKSWNLPLSFDDPVQPLYRGMPLPSYVLEAAGIKAAEDGSYESSDPDIMAQACRTMAGWKLAINGEKVAKFASRGGAKGSKNPRKTFGAELADPYAEIDKEILPLVDQALRVVCKGLMHAATDQNTHIEALRRLEPLLRSVSSSTEVKRNIIDCLVYLRDRIGVPRDLPLAAARQFRAHLNWAIDCISV